MTLRYVALALLLVGLATYGIWRGCVSLIFALWGLS